MSCGRTGVRPEAGRSDGQGHSQGVVLVYFAFFFLAFFGLFAVVVDFGIVRATQLQMQASADIAALEGLAGRDAIPGDFMAADQLRRQNAADIAALVFDEDLNANTGPEQFLLGAGPLLDTGVGGVADPAGGLLVASAPWVPALQTNAAENLVHGDLVAGDYTAVDRATPGRIDWHDEGSDYGRLDFASSPGGDAFLARLRRTRADSPLDAVPGVSSRGPTLPYLFGLGSAVLSSPTPDVYDPRRDGVTVRAVAVADSDTVTMAGFARPGLPGLAPLSSDRTTGVVWWLSLDETGWLAVPEGASMVFEVSPSGLVQGTVDGAAVRGAPRLGALVAEGSIELPAEPPAELRGLAYATLHERNTAGVALRVRCFVAVSIVAVSLLPGPVLRIEATKLGRTVAPRNASAQRTLAVNANSAAPSPAAASGLFAAVLAR